MDWESFSSPCCRRTITFIEEWDCGMAVTHHTLCGWNGCRGGGQKSTRETVIQWRLQAMKSFKPSLPCSIMGNVRSLANKLHEPTALAWSQRSLMCFTESWINQDIPDDNASVEGFHTVRANMDSTTSGKQEGGGLAHYYHYTMCLTLTIVPCLEVCVARFTGSLSKAWSMRNISMVNSLNFT